MKLNELSEKYVSKYNKFEEKDKHLKERIELREKQIERLEARRNKNENNRPWWVDELIKPIAIELTKELGNVYYSVLGTFGICAETAIHFYPIGETSRESLNNGTTKSINFIPFDLKKGEIAIRDYSEDTRKFDKGTIGEMNGMNHPTIKLNPDMDIKDLVKFVN